MSAPEAETAAATMPRRQPAAPRGLVLKIRVVWTLVLREVLLTFRQSRFGYFLVLVEPLSQFLILLAIFSLIGRQAGYGTSLGVFLATGIVPFFMFTHISRRVMGAVRSAKSLARVPTVGPLDVALAKGLLEILTLVIVAVLVFGMLAYLGHPAIPRHPERLVEAVPILCATAVGVGMVNGVLSHMFRFYQSMWGVLSRGLLFLSAVFYMPAALPEFARDYLFYNPVMHGIEWFRTGIYETYPAHDLSHLYLICWAVGAITLGVVMIKAAEGRLAR